MLVFLYIHIPTELFFIISIIRIMSSVLCSSKLLRVANNDDNDMTQVYVALIEEDEQTELLTKNNQQKR